MTYAIKAENLGKRYLIGHQRKESYSTLRDAISHGVKNLANRILHPQMNSSGSELEEFWALHDVSFEIQPGDRVGIIGRNGAGKSTLLKILSRITEPTTGRFTTRGRVAALLEVGTGFHPELSGRENIYLNGAILGMSRSDVKRQFDAIVEFAGVEKFLDTPVKRYSSGMYVRLAFAVAAHLEPDILIVDEVLAVGDAEFQKKCLGKMEEVGKEGRTVVFVSHNMSAVRRLCDKGLLLFNGRIQLNSDIKSIIQKYKTITFTEKPKLDFKDRLYPLYIIDVQYLNHLGHQENTFPSGTMMEIVIHYTFDDQKSNHASRIDVGINQENGQRITLLSSNTHQNKLMQGKNNVRFCIHDLLLNNGNYNISIYTSVNNTASEWVLHDFPFEIINSVNEQKDFTESSLSLIHTRFHLINEH